MDSSKQFGGDASLKDYMDPNAASSTISVEQQAQTLARMTLFEKQRRRRLSATRAAVRKHEAGTADTRARRRRDKLAALSPLAKAAGVAIVVAGLALFYAKEPPRLRGASASGDDGEELLPSTVT